MVVNSCIVAPDPNKPPFSICEAFVVGINEEGPDCVIEPESFNATSTFKELGIKLPSDIKAPSLNVPIEGPVNDVSSYK